MTTQNQTHFGFEQVDEWRSWMPEGTDDPW